MKFLKYLNSINEAYDIKIADETDLAKITRAEYKKLAQKILALIKVKRGTPFVLSFQDNKSPGFKLHPNYSQYLEKVNELSAKIIPTGYGSSTKRKLPVGMTATIFFETFAAIGFLTDDSSWEGIEKAAKLDEELIVIKNWSFEKKLKEEAISIVESSIDFAKKNQIKNPHIIHIDIKTFYSKLAKLEDVKYVKDNAADLIVITNGSKSELYSALDNNSNISYSEDDGKITVDGITFFQMSLKASQKGARLGRITTLMNDLYTDNQSSIDLINSDVNEGFLDFIKNIGTYSIKKFNSLKSSLSQVLNKFKDKFSVSSIEKDIKKLDVFKLLNESSGKYSNIDVGKISKDVQNQVKKFPKSSSGMSIIAPSSSKISLPKTSAAKHLLFSNKISLIYLEKIVNSMSNDSASAEKYIQSIITLMRKGSTELPIVILYGDGKSEIISKVPVVSSTDNVDPIIIKIVNSDEYFVIYMYFLIKLEKNIQDSVYTQIQFTNGGGGSNFSLKIEGNMNKTLKSIIRKTK